MSDVPPPEGQNPQQPQQPQQPPQQPAGPQPPPQQQPAGQQPPPQQPQQPQPAAGQGETAGMDPKVANLVAYLFTWLSGLILFFTQKDREVRFHAAQAILFGIAWIAVMIVWTILTIIFGLIAGPLGTIFSILGWVVGLGFVAVWIILMVKGFGMQHYKLPVLGDMAEKWAAS